MIKSRLKLKFLWKIFAKHMSYTIIPEIIVFASITVLIVLVLRRLPQTKKIADVEAEKKTAKSRSGKRDIVFKLKSENFSDWRQRRTNQLCASWKGLVTWFRGLFGRRSRPLNEPVKDEADRVIEAKREISKKTIEKKEMTPPVTVPRLSEADQVKIRDLSWEARKASKKEDYAAAEKYYLEVLKIDENNGDVFKGLGLVYAQQKNFSGAAEAYKQAIRLGNRDEQTYSSLADALLQKKNWQEAIDTLDHVIKINPQAASTYALMGRAYTGLKLHKEALKCFELAAKFDPKNVGFLMFLAEAAQRRGLDVIAKMNLNKVLELDPKNEAAKKRLDRLLKE